MKNAYLTKLVNVSRANQIEARLRKSFIDQVRVGHPGPLALAAENGYSALSTACLDPVLVVTGKRSRGFSPFAAAIRARTMDGDRDPANMRRWRKKDGTCRTEARIST